MPNGSTEAVSILNHVLGPVMRGPSSSHTAASFHLACILRSLLGERPRAVHITFDPGGSYGKVYQQQGVDCAFATGLLGWPLTDERFTAAPELASSYGLTVRFLLEKLPGADHPNTVRCRLQGERGGTLTVWGKSTGGGAVTITEINSWPVQFTGTSYEYCAEGEGPAYHALQALLNCDRAALQDPPVLRRSQRFFIAARRRKPLPPEVERQCRNQKGTTAFRTVEPYCFVQQGAPLFRSAAGMITAGENLNLSLGQLALRYEAELLALKPQQVQQALGERLQIMIESVEKGLSRHTLPMRLLTPTAPAIARADQEGRLPAGGLHSRAAYRALGAMHVNCSMGVVCAAPTGGSAGVLPAVMVTLLKDKNLPRSSVLRALCAAGAIGVIVAERATFAAEVAGCQVEIGAAGAMGAAACVDAAGGSVAEACDAAAVSFQNTMGSVCDLVGGLVEIPCHTRNAVAASSAFVCADLIMGGYRNPIPLDDTLDAVYAVGKSLPSELRVTAQGGLAATPAARALEQRKT